MDDNLAAQVRQRMRERDTESLLKIWRREDGEGWSDEAYEIVRQTLVERGVEPPAVSAVRAPSTVEDEEDVYHSFGRLMSVASWAAALSWLFLGLAVLLLLAAASSLYQLALSVRGFDTGTAMVQFIAQAVAALVCAFFFVLSQAVGQVIYVLLDIEENTRPTALKRA